MVAETRRREATEVLISINYLAQRKRVTILKVAKLQGALDHKESKIVNASLSFLVMAILPCKRLLCFQLSFLVVAILPCKRLLCFQESYVVYSPL